MTFQTKFGERPVYSESVVYRKVVKKLKWKALSHKI